MDVVVVVSTEMYVPSVHWHCWLGIRKSVWPVKKLSNEVQAWLSICSEVQVIWIWSSWCHCRPSSFASL